MEIAKIKLIQLCQHGDLMERYGASLRILGERDLVRPDVLEVIDEAVEITKHNERYACSLILSFFSGVVDTEKRQLNPKCLLPLYIPPRNRLLDPRHCLSQYLRAACTTGLPLPQRRFYILRGNRYARSYRL